MNVSRRSSISPSSCLRSRLRYRFLHRATDQQLVDPLEILGPVEGNFDLPPHSTAPADPDGRSEDPLQFFFQPALGGFPRAFLARPGRLFEARTLHLGLDLAHAPSLVHGATGELDHLVIVPDAQERA